MLWQHCLPAAVRRTDVDKSSSCPESRAWAGQTKLPAALMGAQRRELRDPMTSHTLPLQGLLVSPLHIEFRALLVQRYCSLIEVLCSGSSQPYSQSDTFRSEALLCSLSSGLARPRGAALLDIISSHTSWAPPAPARPSTKPSSAALSTPAPSSATSPASYMQGMHQTHTISQRSAAVHQSSKRQLSRQSAPSQHPFAWTICQMQSLHTGAPTRTKMRTGGN